MTFTRLFALVFAFQSRTIVKKKNADEVFQEFLNDTRKVHFVHHRDDKMTREHLEKAGQEMKEDMDEGMYLNSQTSSKTDIIVCMLTATHHFRVLFKLLLTNKVSGKCLSIHRSSEADETGSQASSI